jgi:DNA-binding LacI/PurR family transcriptional regulator/signal transduction histidine kinase
MIDRDSTGRPTIGILSNSLDYEYQVLIWAGVKAAAKELNFNVICFTGAEINSPNPIRQERNKIFELISKHNIDGLIIVPSTNCNFMTIKEMEAYFKRFNFIPMVSIGIKLKNIPSIIIDNKSGLKNLVDHLIEVHGYKKFLYVGGPINSIESKERLQAFKDSLNEHGIKIEKEYLTNGNYFLQPTYFLVRDFLNKGERFDAIVTASDNMAIGAIWALEEKGIIIPDETAVTGFDDIKSASSISVPLTTVRQPLFKMAKKAVNVLINKINRKKAIDLEVMKTEPVIRKSCGCLNIDIEHVPIEDIKMSSKSPSDFNLIKDSILNKIKEIYIFKTEEHKIDIYSLVIENLIKFIKNELSDKDFIFELDKILKRSMLENHNKSEWNRLLFLFRKKILPIFLNQPQIIIKIEDLIHQARILINEASIQIEKNSYIRLSERTRILQQIMRDLVNSFDVQTLLQRMAVELPKISINSCYLSLYSSKIEKGKDARLILAFNKREQIKLNKDGYLFPRDQLFPRDLINLKETYYFIVEPLIYDKEQLGFIVLDMDNLEGLLITSITDQIRSTIKTSVLLKDTIEKGKKLKDALYELDENKGKLIISEKMASLGRLTAGIAHEMNTPLTTAISAISEMMSLIKEYKMSISNPDVTAKDHYSISKDMFELADLSNKAIDKAINFIKGIKSQTRESCNYQKIMFNAVDIINETILLLNHILKEKNLSIDFVFSNNDISLFGLPEKFSQVITNFITNAIDAMADKKNESIKITLIEDDRKITLKIIDKGEGIPKSIIRKIFDPLFTSKPYGKGTGLGLSIVKEIVNEEFNGKIEVKSKVNFGTTFTIYFEKHKNAS